jgi:hypothetical protein
MANGRLVFAVVKILNFMARGTDGLTVAAKGFVGLCQTLTPTTVARGFVSRESGCTNRSVTDLNVGALRPAMEKESKTCKATMNDPASCNARLTSTIGKRAAGNTPAPLTGGEPAKARLPTGAKGTESTDSTDRKSVV